jgi:hypothetical protein
MWRGLSSLKDLEVLEGDPRFSTLAGRLAHQDELDDVVSGWTEERTPWEAATELQAVGVAACPVLDNWAVLTDPQLEARDFFRVLPHARFEAELSYGQAIVLSDTSPRFERAAPAFGEDTRDVLREVAGLNEKEVQAAIDSGVAHEMEHPEIRLERPYLHWIPHLMALAWPSSNLDPARILYDQLATGPSTPRTAAPPSSGVDPTEPVDGGDR